MYTPFAWGRLRAEAWQQFENHYANKVKPVRQGMKGLRQRRLWRGTKVSDEVISWSMWESLEDLRSYETSEARRDLAREAELPALGAFSILLRTEPVN